MTHPLDPAVEECLWDPARPCPADVAALEGHLRRFRFDPAASPLALPTRAARVTWRPWLRRAGFGLAAAATLLALAAFHHWSWPDNRPWPMTLSTGGEARPSRLEVGRTLQLGPGESARVDVARIGIMDLRPGTDLTLRATASNRHRIVLRKGAVRVRVWAPSGAVVVQTPAGDAIDLGCAFQLSVGAGGAARVDVSTGWVQLDNVFGEVLVPAGASTRMAPGTALSSRSSTMPPRAFDQVRARWSG